MSASQPSPPATTRLIRVICVIYWLVLTALLLFPDLGILLGRRELPKPFREHGVHFVFLTILGTLAHASRWPLKPTVLAGILATYAVVSEALQVFLPKRTVDPFDFLENLLGVAAGMAIGWLILHLTARPLPDQQPAE